MPDREQRQLGCALHRRGAVPAAPGVRAMSARGVRLLLAGCLATASTALASLAIAEPPSECHTGGLTSASGGWTKIRPPGFVDGGATRMAAAPAVGMARGVSVG